MSIPWVSIIVKNPFKSKKMHILRDIFHCTNKEATQTILTVKLTIDSVLGRIPGCGYYICRRNR